MTTFTGRPTILTTLGGRDPVGRRYLSTESGVILTTEDGKWIIAIDRQNTSLSGRPKYEGQLWDDLTGDWDDLGTMTWDDLFTGPLPTILTGRTIPL